jgi:ATP-dependent phosphoenolpyruvate carboxykinase
MSTMQAARERGLEEYGIRTSRPIHWNLGTAALYEHAIRRQEGELAEDGGAHRPISE